jgi:hypothetical protein
MSVPEESFTIPTTGNLWPAIVTSDPTFRFADVA